MMCGIGAWKNEDTVSVKRLLNDRGTSPQVSLPFNRGMRSVPEVLPPICVQSKTTQTSLSCHKL
jgi:hypothetical protein